MTIPVSDFQPFAAQSLAAATFSTLGRGVVQAAQSRGAESVAYGYSTGSYGATVVAVTSSSEGARGVMGQRGVEQGGERGFVGGHGIFRGATGPQ